MKINCDLAVNYRSLRVLSVSRRQTIWTLTFLWATQSWLLPPTSIAWAVNYHGQVVDAESGKPLEGAVVAVVWHKKPILAMGGITYYHNALLGQLVLEEAASATSWDFFFPVSVTRGSDGSTLIEVGIKSKLFQIDSIVPAVTIGA